MFEGKERRRQLIEELRTTHALQAPEQKIKKQEAEDIEKKKLQEKRLLHKVRIVQIRCYMYTVWRRGGLCICPVY